MEYYRAVVDLNRAPDDTAPDNPDGVIKSHTIYNVPVYRPGGLPDRALQQILLDRYYVPYHRFLAEAVGREDLRLGVDCHSMAALSPPIEADAGTPRPLICLGNLGDDAGEATAPFDHVTCPPDLVRFMADAFVRVFRHEEVEIEVPAAATMNVPFNGGYITRTAGSGPLPFVQIEMSRALYLGSDHFDEESLEIDARRVADLNAKVWRVLKDTTAHL
jgi:formiminoglutamase